MEFIDLNKNWKYCSGVSTSDDNNFADKLEDINLPVDLLCSKPRNYSVAMGEYNSYYDYCGATFYSSLPAVTNYEHIYLEFSGISGVADIYINNIYAANISSSAPYILDITNLYIPNIKNTIKFTVYTSSQFGKYTGLGVAGGIKLIVRRNKIALSPYGVHVVTTEIGDKAHLCVNVCVENPTEQKAVLTLECILYNARNKRVSRKLKRIKLSAKTDKIFEINTKLTRFYEYNLSDPYIYSAVVNVLTDAETAEPEVLDSAVTEFGIINTSLTSRGLLINGKQTKLSGAVMARDNGILGNTSFLEAEKFKLSRIKKLGYNAVRYIGCPSDACLSALDSLGLYALIDIFDVWQEGKFPLDGHSVFEANWRDELGCSILKLRNHPSVVMYSLGNNVTECYNRGGGAELAKEIAYTLKLYDSTRPITVNASELVPLRQELESISKLKQDENFAESALKLAREKDLFKSQTMNFFKAVDVAGYSFLHNRYASDKAINARMIIGLATYPSFAFDALDSAEKNSNVIGDFKVSGADYLGLAVGRSKMNAEQLNLIPPHTSFCGDLNLIYDAKPQAYYRQILMGDRSVSLITVIDPDAIKSDKDDDYSVLEAKNEWNLQRYLGKSVDIQVFSGGEVVALYLDGKLIGRKVAGKINKHIATFRTEYYPGKLEAISYHRGVECSRTSLESVGAPKSVTLKASAKTIKAGEVSFIEIKICDKEGRLVKFAKRGVKVSIVGEGRLLGIGSADPESQNAIGSSECGIYDGKALMAIRGTSEGKITIRALSDGLLSGKIVLKVKPAL